MPPAPGTRLGPCGILAPPGAGGMGEVPWHSSANPDYSIQATGDDRNEIARRRIRLQEQHTGGSMHPGLHRPVVGLSFVLLFVPLALLSSPSFAQVYTGRIDVVVEDTTGARLPGVTLSSVRPAAGDGRLGRPRRGALPQPPRRHLHRSPPTSRTSAAGGAGRSQSREGHRSRSPSRWRWRARARKCR